MLSEVKKHIDGDALALLEAAIALPQIVQQAAQLAHVRRIHFGVARRRKPSIGTRIT